MEHSTFSHAHRVTYAECTVGNHVYYARYLDILEAARGEFFRSLGVPLNRLEADGIRFPVREVHLRFDAPARYDDVIRTTLWLNELDRLWVKFGFTLHNQSDELLLEGQTDHVCSSLEDKPKRMPRELLETFSPFLKSPASDSTV